MPCRSCVSKETNTQSALAAKLGIDLTGVKGKNVTRRDAFAEWVAAANGSWGNYYRKQAVVETPDSRRADIFNRNEVILKDVDAYGKHTTREQGFLRN